MKLISTLLGNRHLKTLVPRLPPGNALLSRLPPRLFSLGRREPAIHGVPRQEPRNQWWRSSRSVRISYPFLWLGLFLSCTFAPLVSAQNDSNPFHAKAEDSSTASDATGVAKPTSSPDVPAAALLTNEGKRLAQQLKNLRRSEASMGASHPSLGGVRAEIEAVKQRLATFAEKSDADANRPLGALPKSAQPMTGDQLRELVLQMSEKIEQLERRIFVLERQLGTIEQ